MSMTKQNVKDYLNKWKSNINAAIANKDVNKTIDDFPETKEAFERMCQAWHKAFDDPSLKNIDDRDKAIQVLGEYIGSEIKTWLAK